MSVTSGDMQAAIHSLIRAVENLRDGEINKATICLEQAHIWMDSSL